MENIKLLKHGLLIMAVAVLIACGGGGGGSSGPTYSGITDPGKVTRENGDEVLGATMDGASPGAQTANLSSDSSNPDQQKARLTGIAGRLKNLTQNAAVQLNSNNGTGGATAAIVPVNATTPGNCKGDGSDGEQIVSGSYDDETFDINMTMQYNQFCHTAETDGATMSGSISVTGSLNFDTDEFVFSMSFNNLTTEDGTDSLTMNGSIAMSGQGDTFVVTMSFDFRDNNANKVYRVKDYRLSITEHGIYPDGFYTAEISGQAYHPDYGSYTIETLATVYVSFADDYPYQGAIKITGDNSSEITTFHSDATYTLEIDEGGDGIIDVTKSCDAKTDVCTEI